MGAWEALRRTLSTIYGREVTDNDASLIKIYPKGSAPTTGDNIFPVYAFTPNSCPPGYEYYTDTNGIIAVKCLHNTSGALTVTEASASTISSNLSTLTSAQLYGNSRPMINYAYGGGSASSLGPTQPRIGRATATTAAGAFSNLSLVPALAGYYGVCKMYGVVAQNNAAAGVLTFESPAGTGALPSVFTNAYTANVLNRDLEGLVVSHATLVDNQAIVVDGAAWGAGDVVVIYEYWYET